MMPSLLALVLAVFWAWELVILMLPGRTPAWAQALMVPLLAWACGLVPHDVVTACAVAGGVGLLHHWVSAPVVTQVRRPGRQH